MHLLPTNYQKSQFCHSILTVWIARQSTSWNYLKSTWITWRPSILNFRCRNSISIWLCYYRAGFDFSESVRVNALNLINIHESSSSLILSAFYTVLISRICIIIIIIIIIVLSGLLLFFLTETLNNQKKHHRQS